MTPQDIDRFGINQCIETWDRRTIRTWLPTQLGAPVRRLGLTLKRWMYSDWTGHSEYNLDIEGRSLLITHYKDGRVKIWFDDRVIYEQRKRQRQGQTVVVEEFDPQLAANEREKEREARIEAARQRLSEARDRHRAEDKNCS